MQWRIPCHKILTLMESLVSVSDNHITIQTSSTFTFVPTTLQQMVVLILLFQILIYFKGHVTYTDHLIYGEFNDETVAKLVPSPVALTGYEAHFMHDIGLRTYWQITSGGDGNARLKYTFNFPIIFEKLVIVKPPGLQKQR